MTDLFIPGTPIGADSPTSPESCWQTPQWLIKRIKRDVFPGYISLDPCTTDQNPTGARRIYTPENDGLALPWSVAAGDTPATIFVNPPFCDAATWGALSWRESREDYCPMVVFLGPASVGTRWFHDTWALAHDALFIGRRLRFEGVCVHKIPLPVENDEKPKRKACCLGPDAAVHAKDHPEYHRYTEGSPTRGTVLFSMNCSLERLADLGTIARAA